MVAAAKSAHSVIPKFSPRKFKVEARFGVENARDKSFAKKSCHFYFFIRTLFVCNNLKTNTKGCI